MGQRGIYRADIDGLRCVAVLAVVTFHYGVPKFSGGFVGVDVFFVISGFVITSQIFRELQDNSFSLLTFYDRRIRRILPATVVVIGATLVAGSFLLPPSDYARLGHSAIASGTGLANFYFFAHSGYFEPAHKSLPLLHTWSLGVEEQFYVVWPLLLVFLARRSNLSKPTIVVALIITIALSFAASVAVVRFDQSQAFYMLYTRAWELGLGALLVFLPAISSVVCAELAAGIGAGLIYFAIVSLSSQSVFPGANALWPCLGAALIIMPKQRETMVARLLSQPPFVFVGAISFSLYLWHWPLYVFYAYYNLSTQLTANAIFFLTAASFALATASYFLIEQPIRRLRPRRVRTVASGALATACICAVGSTVVAANGFPARFSPESLKFYAFSPAPMVPEEYQRCFLTSSGRNDDSDFDVAKCLHMSVTKPNVMILGDSHAAQFGQALRLEFPDINFIQVTASGCQPVLPLRGRRRCTLLLTRAFNEFLMQNKFDGVLLSARWRDLSIPHLRETVDHLLAKTSHVTVLGPNLEYELPLPMLLAKVIDRGDEHIVTRAAHANRARKLTRKMQHSLEGSRADFFSVMDAQCDGEICKTITADKTPMVFDDNHLTLEGAVEVLRDLKRRGLFSWSEEAAHLDVYSASR